MEIALIILSICLISVLLGEHLSFKLPSVHEELNRKPFNCRPCTTFHLTWTLATMASMVMDSIPLFFAGIAAAFIIFLTVKFIDNQKIIK